MNLDFILILVGCAFAGVAVGFPMAKFAVWVKKKAEIKKAQAFLAGEEKNLFNLDGEMININKFKWKNYDKKDEYLEILQREKRAF